MKFELKWNKQTKRLLENTPDKIVQNIAFETLNLTAPIIPVSSALERNLTRGRLRRETVAAGVKKSGNYYYLESPTFYANYVYNFNDATTNWSTPDTHSHWFDLTWEKQGKLITDRVIERNKL